MHAPARSPSPIPASPVVSAAQPSLPAAPAPPVAQNQPAANDPFADWKCRLRKEEDKKKYAAEVEKRAAARYWVNFGLLLAVVGLTWWYYGWHLAPIFTQALFVSVPVTVWGAWQVLRDWVPSGPLAENQRSLANRILQHRWATEGLAVALAVLVLATSATSSLYLTYSGGTAAAVEVEVKNGIQKFRDNLTVSASQPVQGNPYFLRLGWLVRPVELQLAAVKPFGYQVKKEAARRRLYPWSAVRLNFPRDFEPIDYHVIRVIPGRGLHQLQPQAGDGRASAYDLTITTLGTSKTINLSFDCLYFGAPPEAIDVALQNEGDQRVDIVREHLFASNHHQPVLVPMLEPRARHLAAARRMVELPQLKAGDVVEFVILPEGAAERHCPSLTVPIQNKIHNYLLEYVP